MKRTLTLTAVLVFSIFASLVSIAQAGDNKQPNNKKSATQKQVANQSKQQNQAQKASQKQVQKQVSNNQSQSLAKHHHVKPAEDKPQGPGMIVDPIPVKPQPPARPGYTFVDGHWERARAPQTATISPPPLASPLVSQPIVRDHRDGQSVVGQPIVRDHRDAQPIVRDHRTGSTSAPGGVTVTTTPKPVNAPFGSVLGSSPTVRDHRDSQSVVAQPIVRDHRTGTSGKPFTTNGGVTVTTTPGGATRDHAITGTGWPFSIFDVGSVPPNNSAPRDHRTPERRTGSK